MTQLVRRFALVAIVLSVFSLTVATPTQARPLVEVEEPATTWVSWQAMFTEFFAWLFPETELTQATEKVSGMWVPDGLD